MTAPYDPSQPLRHDASDEQIVKRHFVLFKHEGSEFPDPVAVAREFAEACVAHEYAALDAELQRLDTLLGSRGHDVEQAAVEVVALLAERDAKVTELRQRLLDTTPTADAVIWREACNKARDQLAERDAAIAGLRSDLRGADALVEYHKDRCTDLTARLAAAAEDTARLAGALNCAHNDVRASVRTLLPDADVPNCFCADCERFYATLPTIDDVRAALDAETRTPTPTEPET